MESSNRESPPIAFIRVEYTVSVSLKATVLQRVAKNPNEITVWFLGLPGRVIMHTISGIQEGGISLFQTI